MAIKKSLTLENGLVAKNAYIRIINVSITNKQHAVANLSFGVDETAMPFQHKTIPFAYNLQGENAWKQAYTHIKLLPEYEDAIDC